MSVGYEHKKEKKEINMHTKLILHIFCFLQVFKISITTICQLKFKRFEGRFFKIDFYIFI